jgi:RNase H-like domain found in reverse transcriptase/Reverse transcriptase (RNA-dependent DNA polymerase)/Integrase zinc binding domain/Chromo (CHRromatin Organisation MOdifier) domain/Integrase core domain
VDFTLDTGAEINIVSQTYVVQHRLEAEQDAELPRPKWIEGSTGYVYGAYKIRYRFTDDWGKTRESESLFYSMDKQGVPFIFGMPGCAKERLRVDTATGRWRFGIDGPNVELEDAEKFGETLDGESEVFAIILSEVQNADFRPLTVHAPTEEEIRIQLGTAEADAQIPKELQGYKDVFSATEAGRLPENKATDHAIETTQDPPFGPLYNLSASELAVLRQYIEDALRKGWIRRSTSPAGAPILFVPKKDGTLRLCVDYRGLNKVTVKNRHALPLISETLDRLSGAKVFTKLDLKDAYHRIRIREGDEWKTAFRTRYGHFEYTVMPFGLSNAPATFQAYINRALVSLMDTICVVYLDDILIYSNDLTSHWRHVKEVLERLRRFRLYANLKKCVFATDSVEFLGFVVSTVGVSMDHQRIETITKWPVPKSYHEVQVFLGFTNFFRRFILGYSKITAPLTGLLQGSKNGRKSGPFLWDGTAEGAFRTLCQAFRPGIILVHFDPEKRIRVETDASGFALSGILSQLVGDQWKPVAFWSRKLQGPELNYETHDSELLAIVAVFKQWRHYLEGSKYTIEVLTDHNNLRGFMSVKALTRRQARWAVALAPYDFTIQHRPGKTNPADGPSRRPDYESKLDDNLNRLLPTLQEKLRATTELATVFLSAGGGDSALPPRNPGQSPFWGRLYQTIKGHQGIELGEVQSGKQPVSTSETDALLNRGKDTTGIIDCKQYIPRRTAVLAVSSETVFDPPTATTKELIRELQLVDELAKRKRLDSEEVARGSRKAGSGNWKVDPEGIVRFKSRLYVPEEKSLQAELLKRHHDDILAGHFGVEKTLDLLQRKFYWPKMAKDVRKYIQTCDVCQRVKTKRHRPYGELQPLPRPKNPWKEITMDFITDLPPSSRGGAVYNSILVVVDRFTKMALYIPVNKTITSAELADILTENIICKYGKPNGIVTDRGSVFTSTFWSEFCYASKVKRRLSTAFHPQTDGQTERQNQTIEHWLRCYCSEDQSNWAKLLPLAEFAYNNAKQSSSKYSPFYTLYGYNPEFELIEDSETESTVPAAQDRAKRIQEVRNSLTKRYHEAAAIQAKYYNKLHEPKKYNKGDLVLLSTKNLKQRRPSKKLSHKHAGPFRIVDVVGTQAYRLALPEHYRIHPTFHVSLLEPYNRRPDGTEEDFLPPPTLIDQEEEYEVEEILEKRTRKKVLQYLVKWVGWPNEYNQWVPAEDMNALRLVDEFQSKEKERKEKKKKEKKRKNEMKMN